MSDKQIVESSDLVSKLLPGDVVIADRGFTCDDYARMALAEIKILPFTKGKSSLIRLKWTGAGNYLWYVYMWSMLLAY